MYVIYFPGVQWSDTRWSALITRKTTKPWRRSCDSWFMQVHF